DRRALSGLCQRTTQLKSIRPAREHQIQEHQVRGIPRRRGGSVPSAVAPFDRKSFEPQVVRDQSRDRLVVFDQENTFGHHTAIAGNESSTSVPIPTVLLIAIRPRWYSTIRRAIARPRPLPASPAFCP